MPFTKVKVGSLVEVPVFAGWTASSSDSSVISCAVAGTTLLIEAKRPGTVALSIKPAADVSVTVTVQVI